MQDDKRSRLTPTSRRMLVARAYQRNVEELVCECKRKRLQTLVERVTTESVLLVIGDPRINMKDALRHARLLHPKKSVL